MFGTAKVGADCAILNVGLWDDTNLCAAPADQMRRAAGVTGFGCRPITAIDTRTTGPAFESRQGRKARDWGTQFSRRYGDLIGAVGSA
jgi:hypothetical protein